MWVVDTHTHPKRLRQRVAAREAMGRPTTLVMPSGNSFSSRMHGQIPAAALNGGKPFVIPWRLQPTDLRALAAITATVLCGYGA